MKNYEVQSIVQPSIKDALVLRSRQQAFDVFVGKLLKYLIPVIAIETLCYVITGRFINFVIALPSVLLALFEYAKALVYFTNEDRDYLYSNPVAIESSANNEPIETDNNQNVTIIPQATGKGIYYLHVALSNSQLRSIANAILDTETLTVNFLESLKISRPNSEKIRAELAQMGILQFDDKGRVKVTNSGIKICKRILND